MNNEQIEELFCCNLKRLSLSLQIEIEELKRCLVNGSIFVFRNLDHIAEFYTEADLNWKECLKKDLSNKTVIYTQHQFWML
mgnify:CR=1 FL=1